MRTTHLVTSLLYSALAAALCGSTLLACDTGDAALPGASGQAPQEGRLTPAPAGAKAAPAAAPAPVAKAHREGVCGEGDDVVLDALCGRDGPTSLLDLRARLGLVDRPDFNGKVRPPLGGAITSTTSLGVGLVSEANPRVVLVGSGEAALFLAFARGAPLVELAAQDRRSKRLTFYLVRFDPPGCSDGVCAPGSLLLPSVESGWTNVTWARDEDLEDTPHDCLGCHRPDGPQGERRLLQREQEQPWLHWIGTRTFRRLGSFGCYGREECEAEAAQEALNTRRERDPGLAVGESFAAVHPPDELYGSVAVHEILEHEMQEQYGTTLRFASGAPFPTREIFDEVFGAGTGQPFTNVPAGVSPTWSAAREASLRAEAVLPYPYHDAKASDPAVLARYAATYRAALRDPAAAADLPSARELLLPAARRALLLDMDPALSGDEVLARACSQCHNASVRPGLARARFDARDPDRLSRAEKDAAIARLRLPKDDPRRMPPPVFRDLDDASLRAAIARLER